jgi:hypothetical protein
VNVSSVGAGANAMGIGGADQQDFRARMQQSMAPVAQLFGMTSDQLMSAVQSSGGSLADYAASKGISNTDLTAAIKQGLADNAPNGVQLSDTQLTNLAQRIENHKPGDFPSGPHSTSSGNAVGTSSVDLKADLEKLIADLKASSSTSSDSSSTSSSTDASSSALLELLTKFDQRL